MGSRFSFIAYLALATLVLYGCPGTERLVFCFSSQGNLDVHGSQEEHCHHHDNHHHDNQHHDSHKEETQCPEHGCQSKSTPCCQQCLHLPLHDTQLRLAGFSLPNNPMAAYPPITLPQHLSSHDFHATARFHHGPQAPPGLLASTVLLI